MSVADPTPLAPPPEAPDCLDAGGPGPRASPPVPRLSLDAVAPPKDACDGGLPQQPLTCGSDRSTATRTHPAAAPAPGGTPTAHAALPPLPPPPLPYSEPSTPRSPGFASPRAAAGLSLAPLTLASPRPAPSEAALRTPRSPPMLSPHSPRSPSMMSPLRLVGTRSPCSVRVSGASVRLCADGTIRQTPVRAAGPAPAPGGGPSQENAGGGGGGGANGVKRPQVSRSLPFSQPTAAAAQAAAPAKPSPDLERFQRAAPLPLGCRELSFSDLLSPRAHQLPALLSSLPAPAPVRVPLRACGTASLPALPATAAAAPAGSPSAADGGATPRKRPRKSAAPQRADFGGDAGDSSAGETSGNGAVAMAWEEDAHPGQTSAATIKHARR